MFRPSPASRLSKRNRPTLDARLDPGLEPVEFVAGEKSSRILRRRELPGKLLEQPEEVHDEARQWFQQSLLDFRRAFEGIAPAHTSSAPAP